MTVLHGSTRCNSEIIRLHVSWREQVFCAVTFKELPTNFTYLHVVCMHISRTDLEMLQSDQNCLYLGSWPWTGFGFVILIQRSSKGREVTMISNMKKLKTPTVYVTITESVLWNAQWMIIRLEIEPLKRAPSKHHRLGNTNRPRSRQGKLRVEVLFPQDNAHKSYDLFSTFGLQQFLFIRLKKSNWEKNLEIKAG